MKERFQTKDARQRELLEYCLELYCCFMNLLLILIKDVVHPLKLG